jgi:hypothetical protein
MQEAKSGAAQRSPRKKRNKGLLNQAHLLQKLQRRGKNKQNQWEMTRVPVQRNLKRYQFLPYLLNCHLST